MSEPSPVGSAASPAPSAASQPWSWRMAGDHGAGSVVVLAVVGVVLALTVGGLVVAAAVLASHRARVAVDLGSLAGAAAVQDGATPGRSCALAGQVARANGADVESCSSTGDVIDLRVSVRVGLWPRPATARARAGPAP